MSIFIYTFLISAAENFINRLLKTRARVSLPLYAVHVSFYSSRKMAGKKI